MPPYAGYKKVPNLKYAQKEALVYKFHWLSFEIECGRLIFKLCWCLLESEQHHILHQIKYSSLKQKHQFLGSVATLISILKFITHGPVHSGNAPRQWSGASTNHERRTTNHRSTWKLSFRWDCSMYIDTAKKRANQKCKRNRDGCALLAPEQLGDGCIGREEKIHIENLINICTAVASMDPRGLHDSCTARRSSAVQRVYLALL